MHTKILKYDEVNQQDWDDFVWENSGGYAYHLYDVIALDRWINDKNHSFAIYDEDRREIVLIAQLHIEKRLKQGGDIGGNRVKGAFTLGICL